MNLFVLTPGKEIYNGEIFSVKVPGTLGEFEVRQNHASIVSSLKKGPVKIKTKEGKTIGFHISNGFIEVLRNEVSLLVQGYKELA